MAALAIFALTIMLVHDAEGLAPCRAPLRQRLLGYSAACIVLGASALLYAVAIAVDDPNDIVALAGFLASWLPAVVGRACTAAAGVHGRTLPRGVASRCSGRGGSRRSFLLAEAEQAGYVPQLLGSWICVC
ncbi:unnamed protein product [Urochloa humidicola]